MNASFTKTLVAIGVAAGLMLTAPFAAAAAETATAAPPAMDHPTMTQGDPSTRGSAGGMSGMMHDGSMGMQHEGSMGMMEQHRQMMAKMHAMQGAGPSLPGQGAFGAIAEIVAMLEADPATDWSKVDLEALRQHLIDMNEVTLNASAVAKPIEGGLAISVTGAGRTLAAIQRMVPAHASEIDGSKGWSAKASPRADGVLLTVTATDPKEIAHIRGLGFAGIMASGSHHQAHHLAIAKGEPMHAAGAEHAQHVH
jgi:hypothetical protein